MRVWNVISVYTRENGDPCFCYCATFAKKGDAVENLLDSVYREYETADGTGYVEGTPSAETLKGQLEESGRVRFSEGARKFEWVLQEVGVRP